MLVEGRVEATGLPAGSLEHGLSVSLPYAAFARINPYGVTHHTVEDDVSDNVATELFAPFLGSELGGERGAVGPAIQVAHCSQH